MTKLSDIQILLLTTAATREGGSLLPPPDLLGEISAPIRKAIAGLIRRALAEEIPATAPDRIWRTEGDQPIGLIITDAGRTAIAPAPLANATTPTEHEKVPIPSSKIGQVVEMLKRESGATLDEIVSTTGWLPHTTRAALTGLRKKGHVITRDKRNDASCYRIMVAA